MTLKENLKKTSPDAIALVRRQVIEKTFKSLMQNDPVTLPRKTFLALWLVALVGMESIDEDG